LYYFITERLI